MIGDATKKYQSGHLGPTAISNTKGDPGGASYGTYQLSSKAGTLYEFIKFEGLTKFFAHLQPGTIQFNMMWRKLASNPRFIELEHHFIDNKKYKPVRAAADKLGIKNTIAIDEALWSIAIQHGRAINIVKQANIQPGDSELDTIKKLYNSRRSYVKAIKLPTAIRQSLLNRYNSEEKDVLALIKSQ